MIYPSTATWPRARIYLCGGCGRCPRVNLGSWCDAPGDAAGDATGDVPMLPQLSFVLHFGSLHGAYWLASACHLPSLDILVSV